jgi:tetratricopeptide (TPR) repeat protein
MKAIILASTAALLAGTAPAAASVTTLGGSFARSCYLAADARNASPETLANCNRALTRQSLSSHDLVATHVNRGILQLVREEYRLAEADFDRAIAIDPRQAEAWLNKAVARFQQGDSASAGRLAERALLLGTRRPAIAYFARGLANEDNGNLRAAYADLIRARDLQPNWSAPVAELQRYRVRTK